LYSNIFGIFVYQVQRLLAITIRYTFKLPTYIQEPLVIGRRSYVQRNLQEKMVNIR